MAFDNSENNIGAGRKKKRGVGREALILACMLEAEAVTFIPQTVAKIGTMQDKKVQRATKMKPCWTYAGYDRTYHNSSNA